MSKFSINLKYFRLKNKLTIKNLAKLIKVHPSTVSSWENNKTSPKSQNLYLLCKIFNVRCDYLLGINIKKKHLVNLTKCF